MASLPSLTLGNLTIPATDWTSHDSHYYLKSVLRGSVYKESVKGFKGDKLRQLVNDLDQILDHLHPCSTIFSVCLNELSRVCGRRTVLPVSYRCSFPLDPELHERARHGEVVSLDRFRVKRVTKLENPPGIKSVFCREAVKWKRLNHENLIPFLKFDIDLLQLVSRWIPGEDLPTYTLSHRGADRVALMFQVACGLRFLHTWDVIHHKLKGTNVIVDGMGKAVITDFGLAMINPRPSDIHYHRWTAPEVLRGRKYEKEADIFSFAMLMVEAFTSCYPFPALENRRVMRAILKGDHPPRPIDPVVPDVVWKLMRKCWNSKPESRPTACDVLLALRPNGHDRLVAGFSLN